MVGTMSVIAATEAWSVNKGEEIYQVGPKVLGLLQRSCNEFVGSELFPYIAGVDY